MRERKPVIQLYGMSSPNVEKVVLMLEECELPYRTHHVQIAKGEQFTPAFLALSPNNKVPVIVDEEGPEGKPFTVFESGAILWYLAEKTGKFWPATLAERSRVMQWTMFQMGTQGPQLGQFTHFTRNPPPDIAADNEGLGYARGRYRTEVLRIYGVLERRLGEAEWLAGTPGPSLADLLVIPWIRYIREVQETQGADYMFDPAERPNLMRWSDALLARPAMARTIAAIQNIRSQDQQSFGTADPDALDRFFNRGRWMQK
jgi:GST-like protein